MPTPTGCGHCKQLAPIYERAAREMAGSVHFGKVDGTREHALMSRFAVRGYPTIFFIHGNEVREYKGARSLEAMKWYAASGGWSQDEPLTGSANPLGSVNSLRAAAMALFDVALRVPTSVADMTGIPDVIVMFAFAMVLLMTFAGGSIALALYLGDDRRPPPARVHAD